MAVLGQYDIYEADWFRLNPAEMLLVKIPTLIAFDKRPFYNRILKSYNVSYIPIYRGELKK
jgi:hypothetical protein